jgi:hypothetical protein
MTPSPRTICDLSFNYLIRHQLLPSYEKSGRFQVGPTRQRPLFRPEERKAAHYASLRGQLYQSLPQWRQAYQLIRSFTKKGREGSAFRLPRLWGALPVHVNDLFEQLPHAFAALGFECQTKTAVGRTALFRLSESCRVEHLPEPYGKWQQHPMQRPQWDRPAELQIEARCQLMSAGPTETSLDLTLSTFAIPVAVWLGRELSHILTITPPLQIQFGYLRHIAQLQLNDEQVDLSQLQ